MKSIFKWTALVVVALTVAFIAFAFWQGRKTPDGQPQYVALGSSFAAGAGLGPLQSGSPMLCARSVNGYPQQLARTLKLSILDMSCGGATARHVLDGGQFFQGPQIGMIDERTRLVTITVGGNDIGYIGDLSMLAARHTNTLFGRMVRAFWSGPKAPEQRGYGTLQERLDTILRVIHERAPKAVVVLATYPTILPASGTCPRLSLSGADARTMRDVANELATVTRAAAQSGHALLVDMNELGANHHACANDPWTRGWTNGGIAPFHPTLDGAKATALAIAEALRHSPASVAAIRQYDAAGHEARSVGRQEERH